jgi:hypothetical protein
MHPIARRLTIHPSQFRGFGSGMALQNERQREQAAHLAAIAAP